MPRGVYPRQPRQRRSRQIQAGTLPAPPAGPSRQVDEAAKPYTLKSLVEYRLEGKTLTEIARLYGKSKQAIQQRLKGVWELLDREALETYRERRADLLTLAEQDLLSLLVNPEKQKKASLNNVAYALWQVFQARRLEEGQSTVNLALHEIVESIEREQRERRREIPGGGGPADASRANTEAIT